MRLRLVSVLLFACAAGCVGNPAGPGSGERRTTIDRPDPARVPQVHVVYCSSGRRAGPGARHHGRARAERRLLPALAPRPERPARAAHGRPRGKPRHHLSSALPERGDDDRLRAVGARLDRGGDGTRRADPHPQGLRGLLRRREHVGMRGRRWCPARSRRCTSRGRRPTRRACVRSWSRPTYSRATGSSRCCTTSSTRSASWIRTPPTTWPRSPAMSRSRTT